MRLQTIPVILALVAPLACLAEDDWSSEVWLREAVTIAHERPTSADSVEATLVPGDVFMFHGRYHYVAGGGEGPSLAWFAPANVDEIPLLYTGNTIKVIRGGQASLARLIGVGQSGLYIAAQAASPFEHQFAAVPWTAWGPLTNAVTSCASEVEGQRRACIADTLGELSLCGPASASELGECASNQDFEVAESLGATPRSPIDFECLLPHGYSTSSAGMPVSYTDANGDTRDCLFFGVISQEPGDGGCVTIYDGSFNCDGVWIDVLTSPTGDGTIY